jgi:hypothetical protein
MRWFLGWTQDKFRSVLCALLNGKCFAPLYKLFRFQLNLASLIASLLGLMFFQCNQSYAGWCLCSSFLSSGRFLLPWS